MHDSGEGYVTNLYDNVDMIGHKAKSVDSAYEILYGILKEQVQPITVPILKENQFSCISTEDYVVDGTGNMNARFARHEYYGSMDSNIRKLCLTPKVPNLQGLALLAPN